MGWLDSLRGNSTGGASSDPLAKLDPKLREFLEKESPLKYQQQQDEQRQQGKEQKQGQPERSQHSTQDQTVSPQSAVPSESLYQDGRYADLWKTYRPLASVEADTKSEHERLMDILDAYKDRRAQIGRTALENCALEQIEWNDCIKNGPLSSRMTMCHEEMKKFERCYNMQSVRLFWPSVLSAMRCLANVLKRLLKALGYLNTYGRSAEMDERIQLHADALYHRMLQQESEIEKAKAEGRPVPALDFATNMALPKAGLTTAVTAPATAPAPAVPIENDPTIPEDIRKQFTEKLAKLPAAERSAEEAALRAELVAHAEMSTRVTELRAAQQAAREQRKADGKATLKDRVSGLFGH
ncbi:hypothetical protein SEPCBS119000_004725 [Sporothrix epigloea]|uniref:Autophagy-related protein 6 n=1 Tax=Sporothrix epigloea TaxID=1892477 RepID=A0ABP0DTP3_9PEZI